MDLAAFTTRIWKIVDHNPGVFLALVVAIALTACDTDRHLAGKVQNPFDDGAGELATAEEINEDARDALEVLERQRVVLTQRIEADTVALTAIGDEEGRVIDRANDAIERAEVRTAQNRERIAGLINLLSAGIPSLGPFIPMILAGGLGTDVLRKSQVIKKLKNGNGNGPEVAT